MARTTTRLLIGGAVLALSGGYLGVTAARSGWVYYVEADQLVTGHHPGERVRVHGTVGSAGVEVRRDELSANFELVGRSARVRVEYHGAVPDLFAPGRQVVAEGALDERGVFVADTLLTKCASKYEGRAAGQHGEQP
jgi:cytochrome c-type biogenesis protein CcmE